MYFSSTKSVTATFSPPPLLPPISKRVASVCCWGGTGFEAGVSSSSSKRPSFSSQFTYKTKEAHFSMFYALTKNLLSHIKGIIYLMGFRQWHFGTTVQQRQGIFFIMSLSKAADT
jgi:hypothetical protein